MVQLLTTLIRRARPPRPVGRKEMLELLFADQTVMQLPALPPVDASTWAGRLAVAEQAIRTGEAAAALEPLRAILADETAASRAILWAAATLRALAQQPARAGEILGVVLEVPVAHGIDYLAAYADGTARYVNHAGPMIIWEVPDPHVDLLVRELLAAAAPAEESAVPSQRMGQATGTRVTLLQTSGNKSLLQGQPRHADLFKMIHDAGLALMIELINRSKNH
jgi:hypothetical protein